MTSQRTDPAPPVGEAAAELAPAGELRVAINMLNIALAQARADGSLGGRSIDLAERIGERLDRPLRYVRYDGPGAILAAADRGEWDIAFLAADPARAAQFHISPAYLTVAATYLVAAGSPARCAGDIDRPGAVIASTSGAAFDLHLRRVIAQARIIACETPAAAMALLSSGGADTVAGIRAPLEETARRSPAFRVVDGDFATLGQAILTPRERPAAAAFLDAFVAGMMAASGAAADEDRQQGDRP